MKRLFGWVLAGGLAVGLNAHAANFYVDIDWAGAETGGSSTPFNTIGEAVTAANAGAGPHTIYIASGTYADVANGGTEDYSAGGGSSGGYSLNQRISIYGGYDGWDGAGFEWTARTPRTTVIDLNAAASRAFYQDGFTYAETIDGLTVQNASHTAAGGALYLNAGYGGGVTLNDCLFQNNVTTANGGAVYSHTSEKAGPITNCDFLDNSGASGGALYYLPQYGQAKNIENCTFDGNRATSRGGAVFIDNWSTGNHTQVLGCTFTDNSAANDGGALFNNNSYILVGTSVFHGNSAPDGAAVGGADYWVGGYRLTNCLIYGNTGGYAVQSDQGGRNVGGYPVDMLNCTVTDNPGGGVRATQNGGEHGADDALRVRNSIIASNGGYGIYCVDDTCIVGYNDVWNNTTGGYYNVVADANSISADPLFRDTVTGDYRVKRSSPTVVSSLPEAPALDYLGDARPGGDGLYTMGAFETPVPEPATISLAALTLAAALTLRRRRS